MRDFILRAFSVLIRLQRVVFNFSFICILFKFGPNFPIHSVSICCSLTRRLNRPEKDNGNNSKLWNNIAFKCKFHWKTQRKTAKLTRIHRKKFKSNMVYFVLWQRICWNILRFVNAKCKPQIPTVIECPLYFCRSKLAC